MQAPIPISADGMDLIPGRSPLPAYNHPPAMPGETMPACRPSPTPIAFLRPEAVRAGLRGKPPSCKRPRIYAGQVQNLCTSQHLDLVQR